MGEAKFGLIDGVLKTRSGWLGKVEVVELTYDASVVSYEKLTRLAKQNSCASVAFPMNETEQAIASKHYAQQVRPFAGEVRVVKDTKYYLQKSPFAAVPMTEAQASRINGDVAQGEQWLSPAQRRALALVRKAPEKNGAATKWPSVVGVPLADAWAQFTARAARAATP